MLMMKVLPFSWRKLCFSFQISKGKSAGDRKQLEKKKETAKREREVCCTKLMCILTTLFIDTSISVFISTLHCSAIMACKVQAIRTEYYNSKEEGKVWIEPKGTKGNLITIMIHASNFRSSVLMFFLGGIWSSLSSTPLCSLSRKKIPIWRFLSSRIDFPK